MTTAQTPQVPQIALSNDVVIPQIGFGTYMIPPDDTQRAVEEALEMGYTHIDTAAAYYNEEGVGKALAATGLAGKVFVTTKLRNFQHGHDATLAGFDESMKLLGLDTLDLYLMHWPVPSQGLYVETWQAMVELQQEGRVRAVGVSNFLPEHLAAAIDATGVAPTVNQIEVHPTFQQPATQKASIDAGAAIEAYSPLGHGADLGNAEIAQIADRLGLTPAQVILRWHIQAGRIVIPKSVHPERMRQNLEVPDVILTDADMAAIDALDSPDGRTGGDPATMDFKQDPADFQARMESGS